MGLLDFFRRKALSASPDVVEALQNRNFTGYPLIATPPGYLAPVREAFVQSQAASYGYLYSHQPAVRRVVDFIAANVSQLGLKLYERKDVTEREERGDHPAAESMRQPNPLTPPDQFIFNVVADFLVYDNAYALKFIEGPRRRLVLLPPHAVGIVGPNRFSVDAYRVYRSDGTFFDVDPNDVIHWRGYNPEDPRLGVSKLETLRLILAEDSASQAANVELLKSGLGQAGHIERPLEAPEWSEDARKRFEEDWANRAKASGRRHPVLEEGMEFKPAHVSPKEAQMLEGRQFTREEVAALYGMAHVPPEDDAERQQFYADVLPPLTGRLESVLNLGLLQNEYLDDSLYFEFNLDEKLMGDDRLKALVSASGGPVLTRNEARAKLNLPAKEDGDELVTPLNVTQGGKPSPQVMPPQDPNKPSQEGDAREDAPQGAALNGNTKAALLAPRRTAQLRRLRSFASDYEDVLRKFLTRQERSLKAKQMDEKAVKDERWERELATDLYRQARKVVEREGGITAARLGLADIDTARTANYLKSLSARRSNEILKAIREALADGEPSDVFRHARQTAAPRAALTLASSTAAFAVLEAGQQAPDSERRLKTWIVTSSNSAHPEMDGESVPLYESFSNGEQAPPADHPGCACLLDIT